MTITEDEKRVNQALAYFNALWASIEKHIGVDPECAHWPEVIRKALTPAKVDGDEVGAFQIAEAAETILSVASYLGDCVANDEGFLGSKTIDPLMRAYGLLTVKEP